MVASLSRWRRWNRGTGFTVCKASQLLMSRPYSSNIGKIKDVPLVYTDAKLIEHSKDAGTVSVKRQVSLVPQASRKAQANFWGSVILQ